MVKQQRHPMNRTIFPFIAGLVLGPFHPGEAADSKPGNDAHETPVDREVLGAFLEAHCVACHGPEKQKADFRVDTFDYVVSDNGEALHYQDVLDVLNSGEMPPPEEEKQPTREELEVVIGTLTEDLFEARKRLASTGGKVEMRRLNRREYASTIDHLFGFVPLVTKIPPDGDIENFDTVGSRQQFTTEHLDEYYELARQILETGFQWAGKREARETNRQDPEEFWNSNFRRALEDWKGKEGKVVRLSKMRVKYLDRPHVETGVYLDEPLRHLQFQFRVDPRASYRVKVKAGIEGQVQPYRQFIRVSTREGVSSVFRIDGTPKQPSESVVELRPFALNEGKIGGRVGEDRSGAWLSQYLQSLRKYENIDPENEGLIWIDSFEIDGPFYPQERSFFNALLCPEEPTPEAPSEMVWNDETARELIGRFVHEAFRQRAISGDYLEGLTSYFHQKREKGESFEQAMIDTLAIVLASPSFLFLHEKTDTEEKEARELSPRDLAIRLSYFLTSGPPDEALYRAARREDLSDSEVLRREVERLLASPRGQRFAEGFLSQWADFVRFDSISISKDYPTFNGGLRHSMKQEAIAYFRTLVEENLPIANLVQSDFATLNAQLATHYGIPGVTTNEFTRVSLPADSPRGGYLSQGAFLVAGSNGERTSPTVRGMIVLNRLLNAPPPPPPPNVPELGSDNTEPLTTRGLVELHQSQVQCSSCHNKMDTIGLAMENFDAIGRWREVEKVEGGQESPIEIEGTLPGTEAFSSFPEFQSTLLTHEEDLARAVVESLLVYGLGRDIEFTDEPHIDEILEVIRPDDYRLQDMIVAIAQSRLFSRN